jgi:hypothetical protein
MTGRGDVVEGDIPQCLNPELSYVQAAPNKITRTGVFGDW